MSTPAEMLMSLADALGGVPTSFPPIEDPDGSWARAIIEYRGVRWTVTIDAYEPAETTP